MADPHIDGDRLWKTLHELAEIGATAAGGVRRVALTDEDRAGRDLFVAWCEAVGCTVSFDAMGNLFARREGADPTLEPVAIGSHLDSQPTGGKFDGAYGVMVGLEVLRTLHDHDLTTDAPVEVISWTNEEGARFPPAMIGSGVFAGAFSVEYGHGQTDPAGLSLGAELQRIGYAGSATPGDHRFGAYLEPHIEQGPILEAEGQTIGVVTGAQGCRWYDVEVTGQEAHAGSTPMDRRSDALLSAARLIDEANAIARRRDPDGRATVGVADVSPSSRNTVPGQVHLTVDLRHPDASALAAMDSELRQFSSTLDPAPQVSEIWYSPPVEFDPVVVEAVRASAAEFGYEPLNIVSGAGHDACYVARVAPTGMLFIPCADGLSHNEAESITAEDAAAGAEVALQTVLALAKAA